jgi:OHCU decarboxylase
LSAALDRLNTIPAAKAEAALLECCGSPEWARMMVRRRPFRDASALYKAADRIWFSLGREEWLAAFSSHPKIGERGAAAPSGAKSRVWAQEEQSRAAGAEAPTQTALAAGNREYTARFGYIFIVCATGKTSEEMLALLRQRLQNDPVAELRVAAEEQRRITRLRLEKLLATDTKA